MDVTGGVRSHAPDVTDCVKKDRVSGPSDAAGASGAPSRPVGRDELQRRVDVEPQEPGQCLVRYDVALEVDPPVKRFVR